MSESEIPDSGYPLWFKNIQPDGFEEKNNTWIDSCGVVSGVHVVKCLKCNWKEKEPPSDLWFDVINHFKQNHEDIVSIFSMKEMDNE